MRNSFYFSPNEDHDESNQLVFLANASIEEWQLLMECMMTQEFNANEYLVKQGESDHAVYFVSSGALEVSVEDLACNDKVIATLGAGSIFGEQSFFDRLPRSATVRATESGTLLRLSRERFDLFTHKHPELANKVLFELGRVLSSRLRITTQHLAAI